MARCPQARRAHAHRCGIFTGPARKDLRVRPAAGERRGTVVLAAGRCALVPLRRCRVHGAGRACRAARDSARAWRFDGRTGGRIHGRHAERQALPKGCLLMDVDPTTLPRLRPLDEQNSNERLKHGSRFLRGTLQQSLVDPVTGAVTASDGLLTKFFGIYQQDDRDLRDERRRAKLEPRYQFMVRVRLPGGVCTPAQWLALDALAREFAGNTLRLTTRQTFQFHHIAKRNLRKHVQGIYAAGLDTIAACGDDNRNVICTANPTQSPAHAEVSSLARRISEALMPRTGAYREVFLGAPPPSTPVEDEEPLYGSTYLPRKFKVALAIPPQNDIDVFAHDLG